MRKKKFMLNDDKTEIMLISTQKQLSKVSIDCIKGREKDVTPVLNNSQKFRNLVRITNILPILNVDNIR